ncbi:MULTISPECIES: hypothetical protein [Pseudomonas]|jgi:hypothetical protein|uniref:Uncharacterized protein n=1 Tax=Pseudomonas fluorescens TaxID=294 RepID=A0A0P8WI28_PSEFL|nr:MULTISPECIES: hypothetical protein [Pseudomonas]EJM65795.1 hypothetical protein PMI31_05615 [Pseudomonas sp. GM55]KPU52022.1 hypothetical protein AN403_484 [Pseudomonas fluorescens]RAI64125.1 hypothetical protein DOZ80_26790 [Pseudomonas fluorescens]
MVESQQKATKPELYERLIDRLALALEAARTASRLRDERPLELELRGLSPAEFALVKAYLDRSERETHGCLSEAVKQLDAPRSAKIIWLKDKVRGRDAVKVRSLQFK